MGAQPQLLVDANAATGFIKLEVAQPFPFTAFHEIIACGIRFIRIKINARNENASLVAIQIQRVGAERNGRQAMRVAPQGTNEIAIGDHLAHTTVVLVENRRTDYDAMADAVGQEEIRLRTVDDGVDVRPRIEAVIQLQRRLIACRLRRGTVTVGGITDVVLRVGTEQFERKSLFIKATMGREHHSVGLGLRRNEGEEKAPQYAKSDFCHNAKILEAKIHKKTANVLN